MLWLLSASLFFVASADLFTSVAEMQNVLTSDRAISDLLLKYIESEHQRLNYIQKVVEEFSKNSEKQKHIDEEEIANPINAFLIMKRKVYEWKKIEKQLKPNEATELLESLNFDGVKYPTQTDLHGAAIALFRLQDTYKLDPREISEGRIYEIQGKYTFCAQDCFEIGRAAYNEEDYYHTIMWMEEALRLIEKEGEQASANREQAIEYLAFSLYKQGNLKHALKLTDELYKLNPTHSSAKENIEWYEDLLAQNGVRKSEMRKELGRVDKRRPEGNPERNVYEELCRGEIPVSEKDVAKLYCYFKRDRPFLIYAPIKVEIKRFSPLVVLFKEVISDSEIAQIQRLATPKMDTATVVDEASGKLVTAKFRISKSAWLEDREHEVVHTVNKRIDFMTNLEMKTAEQLQIANYGIGGHYHPHFDHASEQQAEAFDSGNRIATVLFYMSQPQFGGGTVFTDAKSTIQPTKNDALFWYNLFRQGDGNPDTRHAACPVLVGVKWVSNKWIHEVGNEFRRPCGLRQSDAERFVGDLGFGSEPRTAPNLSPDLSKDVWLTL